MKFFTCLYALYILALSLLPCMDKEECANEKTEILLKISAEQESHEHEDENCSPFCRCMCCGQVITNLFYPLKEEKSNQSFFLKNITTYKNSFYSSSYLDRIWQPPKFS